ncbi:30S ribosomal protein S20 [Microaerobacter geothermalis]|uniref:30S ribosomal protein S20 n=1 Tax=Microaerobacter geothermalis TaxID=674972 RepID=UPI001F41D86D|nr:30S ribosomal protein S20 [Microaerobacter geothermalis]MCF6092872.1 30S ribosomal protein S20 [Microaerobacter geothermalis]
MPNIKSAIKRVKQSEKRRAHRVAQKSALRTAIKKVEVAVEKNNIEEATEALKYAIKKLDKAVTKGLIHKNAASRKKSQLSKKVNAIAKETA